MIEGEQKVQLPIGGPSAQEGTPPTDKDRIEREAKEQKFIPPWAIEILYSRDQETGK